MKQSEIKANHTYSGGRFGGEKRRVIEFRDRDCTNTWPGKCVHYYQINSVGAGGCYTIRLKSFAVWAKEDMTP